jgi:hypothetical protein
MTLWRSFLDVARTYLLFGIALVVLLAVLSAFAMLRTRGGPDADKVIAFVRADGSAQGIEARDPGGSWKADSEEWEFRQNRADYYCPGQFVVTYARRSSIDRAADPRWRVDIRTGKVAEYVTEREEEAQWKHPTHTPLCMDGTTPLE